MNYIAMTTVWVHSNLTFYAKKGDFYVTAFSPQTP